MNVIHFSTPSQLAILNVSQVRGPSLESIKYVSGVDDNSSSLQEDYSIWWVAINTVHK